MAFDDAEPPVSAGLRVLSAAGGRDSGLNVEEPLLWLAVLTPLLRLYPLELSPPLVVLVGPVVVGLNAPVRLGPIVVGNFEGLTEFATLLNAPRHCKTCAGSFDSYKSTVRNRSWARRFSGGSSQARRKWEIFSICIKGIGDFLNFTPGEGTARLASLDSSD